uniref:RdRp catalytic domain-containing protein n=1 Tax=Trichuris muris TaxID=70415 RepID=A0A5S6QMV9_TRIMR
MFYLVSRYRFPPGVTQGNRLNPLESAYIWYQDSSGKEGIRQKGWTLATVGGLLYVETLTGVYGTITGQGDNQVIVAMFPETPGSSREEYVQNCSADLQERVEFYLKILPDTFNSIGLPVKLGSYRSYRLRKGSAIPRRCAPNVD